jgi:hypothetical protein
MVGKDGGSAYDGGDSSPDPALPVVMEGDYLQGRGGPPPLA